MTKLFYWLLRFFKKRTRHGTDRNLQKNQNDWYQEFYSIGRNEICLVRLGALIPWVKDMGTYCKYP